MGINLELVKKYGFYIYPDDVNSIRRIYQENGLTIYFMEGVVHNIKWLKDLVNLNSYFYAIIPHWTYPNFFEETAHFLSESFPDQLGLTQIIWMTNTEEQMHQAHAAGMKAIFCNHNCWLDENIFKIEESDEGRVYDLALNCRPETMKNPQLALGIPNLAIIKGINHNKNTYWDLMQLNPAYINNDKRLSVPEVVAILNKSKVGGIFSAKEGACYSSSEFHLCGLPVLSIHSEGGRDVWFTDENSIVFVASPEGLQIALREASRRLTSGDFSRSRIREQHINLSERFRSQFKASLNNIFSSKGVFLDVDNYFKSIYFHKMTKYGSSIYVG